MIDIYAFYQFIQINDCQKIKDSFQNKADELGLKGIFLVAPEGINATVSGSSDNMKNFIQFIAETLDIEKIDYKVSHHFEHPFHRMKVKIKKEIITFKQDHIRPDQIVGKYLNTQEWNDLLNDPDTIIVDTRNDYEYELGTFKNALNPKTKKFTEFANYVDTDLAEFKDKKIATFCTGGVRCEKATSFMIDRGFQNVYHLKGGILKYLEEVDPSENLWEGECFVFDQRVGVHEKVEVSDCILCHGCRHTLKTSDTTSEFYEPGVSCHHCYADLTPEKIKSRRDRQKQIQLAASRNTQHLGIPHQHHKNI